jgi:hypothetical protein
VNGQVMGGGIGHLDKANCSPFYALYTFPSIFLGSHVVGWGFSGLQISSLPYQGLAARPFLVKSPGESTRPERVG